jgi:hypothetical protein
MPGATVSIANNRRSGARRTTVRRRVSIAGKTIFAA